MISNLTFKNLNIPFGSTASVYRVKTNSPKININKSIADNLPQYELTLDTMFTVPYEARELLKKSYLEKLNNLFYEDGELKQEVKEYLDNKVFPVQVEKAQGEEPSILFTTIKDLLKKTIIPYGEEGETCAYHATLCKEYADNIIENGFDTNKIARTKFGPGFYFALSEGGARNYDSAVLKCKMSGSQAIISTPIYEDLMKVAPNVTREHFGMLPSICCDSGIRESFFNHMINEYARDYIVNELGVQMAVASSKANDTCFVLFDPTIVEEYEYIGG